MKISSWSIRNPVPVVALFACLVYVGWSGYGKLRINNMPDIDFPTITVTVSQAGASPAELETQVAIPIEKALATVSGVESVNTTVSDGSSITTVEFQLDRDLTEAVSDVQSQMESIRSTLPPAADAPVVKRRNSGDTSILAFALEAPRLAQDEATWLVDDKIAKAMLAVDGVSKVTRMGGADKEVLVALDPGAMAMYGISVSKVNSAIAAQNENQAAGRVVNAAGERSVRTVAEAVSMDDLRNTRIAISGSDTIRLGDIAKVRQGWEPPRQSAKLNGRDVVAFEVYAAKGASQVKVAQDVEKAVEALPSVLGEGISIKEVTSSAAFVKDSFDAAFEALWVGAGLAVAIVMLFLRDIRATLTAATALPLSLIPTFAVMEWMGLSLNSITLLALSLVVGILVDDAIVEIENIVRHMRTSGKTAYESAMEAADEIGLAVVATTLTIVAVFIPVSFMPGIAGKFFFSFGVVTCVSVLFSLLVARTFTPLVAAHFVKSGHTNERAGHFMSAYTSLFSAALQHRRLTMLSALLFVGLSGWSATLLNKEFMVATDRSRTTINITMPPGSTISETVSAADRARVILADRPEVDSVFSTVGGGVSAGGGPGGRTTTNDITSATVTVNLKPKSERKLSQSEFEKEINPSILSIPGIRASIGGGGSGESYTLTLVSGNGADLDRAAEVVKAGMRTIPGLNNVSISEGADKPEIRISVDKAVASELGVAATDISQLVYSATLGPSSSSLAKYNLGDRQIQIVPYVDMPSVSPADLESMPISTSKGAIPLAVMASIGHGVGPATITRTDGKRSVSIKADMRGITTGEADKAVKGLSAYKNLPKSVTNERTGDNKRMDELFASFGSAMLTGVLLMYLTLALLFGGFLQPITILTALPLSLGGAMSFLYLTGSPLAMTTLIGMLLLMGIAAKNSILLVEYVIMARRNGATREEALLAAALKRARPIIMTSIAMGAGMLPIALGIGADAESRAPMGMAVIGGLMSSTALSLLFVPVAYTYMDDLETFISRMYQKIFGGR